MELPRNEVNLPAESLGRQMSRGRWIGCVAVGTASLAITVTGLATLARQETPPNPIVEMICRPELAENLRLELELLGQINALRADHDLPALELHGQLTAKARDWSNEMAETGIRHSDIGDGISEPWQFLGENIGQGETPEEIYVAFLDSPTHYQNLVSERFQYIGVGAAIDSADRLFMSVVFMEPGADATG